MSNAYRLEQEKLISNLKGTTLGEIALVLSTFPVALWFYCELMSVLEAFYGDLGLAGTVVLEFVVIVVPVVLSFTQPQIVLPMITSFIVFTGVLCTLTWKNSKLHTLKHARKMKMHELLNSRKAYITCFRAGMTLMTCIAILAVDFTIFPRKFAKTETFGASIMDIGVGAFVLSSGLTSKYARLGYHQIKENETTSSLLKELWNLVSPVIVIIILGLVRLIVTKGIEYQEHVSEYGVHWNFYFTLALVYFNFSALKSISEHLVSVPLALIYLFVYQYLLSQHNLTDYIMHADRVDLFSMNREGILSSFGYTSLYILSVAVGQLLLKPPTGSGARLISNLRKTILILGLVAVSCWGFTYFGSKYIQSISRRMVNATYVSWVIAQSLTLLIAILLNFLFSMLPRVPILFRSISTNQLFTFFIANILTGIVNLSMKTIYASPMIAYLVIFVYIGTVSIVVVTLDYYSIKLK